MFTFKFIYNDGVYKLSAYISHQLNFNELKNFIDFWVRKEHNVKLVAPVLYWIDSDGDRFAVSNEAEYHMFVHLNEKGGILWGTSNGLLEISVNVKFNELMHTCEECEFCENCKKYTYNASGYMYCVKCKGQRGNCCILAIEGTRTFKDLTQLLVNGVQEKDEQHSLPKVANDDEKFQVEHLKTRLESLFEKSSPTTNAKTASGTAKCSETISKKRPTDEHVPVHVENALKVMIGMGYNNKKGWLTRLLLSTNGNIGDALEQITPTKSSIAAIKKT